MFVSHNHIIGATVKNLHDQKSREYSGQNSELINVSRASTWTLIFM